MQIKCPMCRVPHTYDVTSAFRPFCSERCRLMDMGAWAQGSYAIAVSDEQDLPDHGSDSMGFFDVKPH